MNVLRRSFAAVPAVALTIALAACGGSTNSSDGESAAGAEPGAFPVTIEHKYGKTTLTQAPKRVVSVGLTDQDSLLAMGVAPVAVTKWFGEAPGFIFPWAEDALGDSELPTVLDDANGVQVEKIIGLKPDLIIGTYSGLTKKDYDTLSKVAPVVAQDGDFPDFSAPWDESAQTVGDAVGRPKAMKDLIDDVKSQIADAAAEHPEFKGKTAMAQTVYEGVFLYGPDDPRSVMLRELGFEFPDQQFGSDIKDGEFGSSVSAERTSDLDDVDLAVWIGLDTDRAVKAVFDKTETARQGRWVDVGEDDGAYYVGHSFVTPLSIPYVLERYVPQLAAAVDGDPDTEVPSVKQ